MFRYSPVHVNSTDGAMAAVASPRNVVGSESTARPPTHLEEEEEETTEQGGNRVVARCVTFATAIPAPSHNRLISVYLTFELLRGNP